MATLDRQDRSFAASAQQRRSEVHQVVRQRRPQRHARRLGQPAHRQLHEPAVGFQVRVDRFARRRSLAGTRSSAQLTVMAICFRSGTRTRTSVGLLFMDDVVAPAREKVARKVHGL